jgi:hypothetical protein
MRLDMALWLHSVKRGSIAAVAATWRRAGAYLAGQAKTPEEQAMLDKAYQQVLAKGPDFINSRTGSEFRQAPKLGINRNAFARIMHALDLIEHGKYRNCRAKGKHGVLRTAATSQCKIMLDICKVLFYTGCIVVEGK